MVRGISSGARVFEYLSLKPSIRISGGGRIPYHSLTGRVDFMDISFRFLPHKENMLSRLHVILNIQFNFLLFFSYPTRPGHQVLKSFNLTLPPSKTVAIVGESGGGTSL